MDTLVQLCPTRGSVVGFVRPRLDFRYKPSMSIAYCTCAYCTCHWPVTTCVYFDILKSDILMQVVLSATLSCLYYMLGDFHMSTGTLV